MQCLCCCGFAFAVSVPCLFAVFLPCLCRVFVVSCVVLAVSRPWSCKVVALVLQCRCPAFAMHLSYLCCVLPCYCRVVAVVWCVCAVSLPWLCRVFAFVCRVFAVFLRCACRIFVVCLQCRGRCCCCVIARSLPVLRVCCSVCCYVSAHWQSRDRLFPPRTASYVNPRARWQLRILL